MFTPVIHFLYFFKGSHSTIPYMICYCISLFMTLQLVWCTLFWSPKTIKDLIASVVEGGVVCEQETQHAVLPKTYPFNFQWPQFLTGIKGMQHTTCSIY